MPPSDVIGQSAISEHTSWSLARPVSVLIVSDVRLVREGIAQALDEDDALLVLGTAAPDVADEAVARFLPDVVLMDMRIGGALDIARALCGAHSPLAVVALGLAESEAALLACAQAGFAGFVAAGATAAEVAKAAQSAMRGELVCTPRVAGMLLSRIGAMASAPAAQTDPDALTPREYEIAALMGEGLSNKQIAFALGIRNATVKNHVHNILSKLRLARRSQVGAWLRNSPVLGLDAFHHPVRSSRTINRTVMAQA